MHNAFVTEPYERLRRIRMEAGYPTPRAAAEAIGVPEPTYYGHENGSRGLGRSAARYARFFQVSVDWLVTGRGTAKPGQKHPVLELWETIPSQRHDEVLDFMRFIRDRK